MNSKGIPKHVAIIMDGNGRWANRRGRPRFFGHIRGSSRVKEIVETADQIGIKALTLYAFSTENWSRPDGEKDVLWRLLKKFLVREVPELRKNNVRLQIIGEMNRLNLDVQETLTWAMRELASGTGMVLTLALSYGSRREIVEAMKHFARDCAAGRSHVDQLKEEDVWKYLWTQPLGDLAEVDLVIRTSGEYRTSNFLLWQAAYAEFYFTNINWPDFTGDCLKEAVDEYLKRDRRMGGLSILKPFRMKNVK